MNQNDRTPNPSAPRPPDQLTEDPCPRCTSLARDGRIPREAVQPLPVGACAPLAQDGSGKCCDDCAAADTLTRLQGMDYEAMRITVSTNRQEQLRLPGAPQGLIQAGLMRGNVAGDFERHHAWLDEQLPVDDTGVF